MSRRRRGARLAICAVVLLASGACVAHAVVVQRDGIRVSLLSQVQPYKLPRIQPAPIAILNSGHVSAVDGGVPDQLLGLAIKVNRHALLRTRGLPRCRIAELSSSSTERALTTCRESLVGSGRFWAHIVLPEQGSYPTQGRLLVFNGRRGDRPALLAHIYTDNPFPTSFVIPFAMRRLAAGTYGTEFVAALPQALGEWGYVDRIKLTLKREFNRQGRRLSYFNAACPAPPGVERVGFNLAHANFSFSGGRTIGVQVSKACGVRE